jgi:transketolase
MVIKKDLKLEKRVLEISKKHGLVHIGSNLSALPTINFIYSIKEPGEKFVLSCGHSGVALYVVLEKFEGLDAEKILVDHGIHATRCEECHISCSTGSLGNGLPIALGMALADRSKNVYCLLSDGECMEGSVYESLRLADKFKADNLKVYVHANGYGGLDKIDSSKLERQLKAFFPVVFVKTKPSPFPGLKAHYQSL